MNYYQARISIDTARLLIEMKKIYEEKLGVTITKGNVIMYAYQDSQWVKDWKQIQNEVITVKKYDIKPAYQKLKVQISEQVEEGIKLLKQNLPTVFESRSVTIGVCIHLILKAAYIKNVEKESEWNIFKNESREIINIIDGYKVKVKEDIDVGKAIDVLALLEALEEEILRIAYI